MVFYFSEMRNEAIAAAKTGRPKGNPEPSSADISQTDVSMEVSVHFLHIV